MHYPTADELFDAQFDLTKLPVINDAVIDAVSDMLDYIPMGYKAEFSLVIDDYGEHDPNSVLSAFNEALRIRCDLYQDENKRHGAKIEAEIYILCSGKVSGGEIVSDVLMLLVLVLYTIGCSIVSFLHWKDKRGGRL